uniref:uncharacterized protein LOC122607817 n=1 Tax=Erigeron canadensis TaxID=72917 RepID=UPI001CB8CF95|nr:uncharacterized protein LOC122607817 [Erigeron canadensis]
METLMFIARHKDENYGRSQNFREISCRAFQSGVGILPTPNISSKLTLNDQNLTQSERIMKHSSVPMQINVKHVDHSVKANISGCMDEFFYSELWAGPAYSNSPPPSSLPIPNFSFKPKRTVSLDIPSRSDSDDVDLLSLLTKSAPASPTGKVANQGNIFRRLFFCLMVVVFSCHCVCFVHFPTRLLFDGL